MRAQQAELWVAAGENEEILGTVTWCPPGSPWRQLAQRDDQAEFRMLSVGARGSPAGCRPCAGRGLPESGPTGPDVRGGDLLAAADGRSPPAVRRCTSNGPPTSMAARHPASTLGLPASPHRIQLIESRCCSRSCAASSTVLVPPLRRPVDAGDQAGPVHPAEVAEDERVAGLGLVGRTLGQAEMPGGVLVPGMLLQEGVLRLGARAGHRPSRCPARTAGRRSARGTCATAASFTVYFAIVLLRSRCVHRAEIIVSWAKPSQS